MPLLVNFKSFFSYIYVLASYPPYFVVLITTKGSHLDELRLGLHTP